MYVTDRGRNATYHCTINFMVSLGFLLYTVKVSDVSWLRRRFTFANDSVSASSCCWWNLHGYLRQMFDFKRHLRVQNNNIDLERKTPRRVYWNAREKREERPRPQPRVIYFSEFWLNQLADHDIEHSPVDWILRRPAQNSTTDRHWSHSSKSATQIVFVFAHRERQSVFTWLIVRWRIPNNDGSTVSGRNRISSIDWQRSGSRMNLHGRK